VRQRTSFAFLVVVLEFSGFTTIAQMHSSKNETVRDTLLYLFPIFTQRCGIVLVSKLFAKVVSHLRRREIYNRSKKEGKYCPFHFVVLLAFRKPSPPLQHLPSHECFHCNRCKRAARGSSTCSPRRSTSALRSFSAPRTTSMSASNTFRNTTTETPTQISPSPSLVTCLRIVERHSSFQKAGSRDLDVLR